LPKSGQQIAATAEDLRSLVNSKIGTLRASNGFSAMSRWLRGAAVRAFSSEVDTGSREENASKQEIRASVLIKSEPIMI
jgi:hypothetical protein